MATSVITPLNTSSDPISYTIKINSKELDSEMIVMRVDVWGAVNKISRATISIIAGNIHLNTFEESEMADFEPGKMLKYRLDLNKSMP